MKAEGVSYRHALEILRAEIPALTQTTPVSKAKRSTVPKLDLLLEPNAEPQAYLQQVIAYYHATLHQSPEAPKPRRTSHNAACNPPRCSPTSS